MKPNADKPRSYAARPRANPARGGYTLVELMMVVVIAVIVAVGAWPDRGADLAQQVKIASQQFDADVSYARSLTIAQPDDPAAIKFDTPNDKYWIARESAVDTPVNHPRTKKPYVVQLGKTGRPQTKDVTIEGLDVGGDSILSFDSTGNTKEAETSLLQLSADGVTAEVAVSPVGAKVTISSTLTRTLTDTTDTLGGALGL